jgi:anti-sigma regulatory factor (Ser/Thr protein kinase)
VNWAPITIAGSRRTAATFPGRLEELRRMRAGLRRELDGCPAAHEVILCASELAANAVLHSDTRHADGTFTVRAGISPCEYVLIEVEDDGGPWAEPTPHSTRGRGLGIVRSLAADWGICATPGGRTVWARFDWSASASGLGRQSRLTAA